MANGDFLSDLRTPERVLDIQKLLSKAGFPIHALMNEALGFRLRHIAPAFHGASQQDLHLCEVSLAYLSPNYGEYDQVAVISSRHRCEYSLRLETALATTIRNMYGFLPRGLEGLSSFDDVWKGPPWTEEGVIDEAQALDRIVWESYVANGMRFNLFHQDVSGQFALASSDEPKGQLLVVSAGVPRPKFLILLESLTELQANRSLADKLQQDVKVANEELKRLLYQGDS
jgi:hypothetical protein